MEDMVGVYDGCFGGGLGAEGGGGYGCGGGDGRRQPDDDACEAGKSHRQVSTIGRRQDRREPTGHPSDLRGRRHEGDQ